MRLPGPKTILHSVGRFAWPIRLVESRGASRRGWSTWERTGPQMELTYRVDRAAGFILGLAVRDHDAGGTLRIEVEDDDGNRIVVHAGSPGENGLIGIVLGAHGSGRLVLHLASTAATATVRPRLFSSGQLFADEAARRAALGWTWQLRMAPGAAGLPRRTKRLGAVRTGDALQRAYDLGACCAAQRPATVGPVPLVSFLVPTCETPPPYLAALLRSFRGQRPGTAELVLSDDGSTSRATLAWLERHQCDPGVTVVRHASRRGIAAATNAGLAVARGRFVALVDHDDTVAPYTTDVLAEVLDARPESRLLYTDEVVTDARLRPQGVVLKPAFDPVLLSGVNYINHLAVYERLRLAELGGLRMGYEGSQDYDLLLRFTRGLHRDEVTHLPYPAYLWRRHSGSYSTRSLDGATASARRALAWHYDGEASVEAAIVPDLHRVRFREPAPAPRVSVVIPTRDGFELLSRVLDGLTRRTSYDEIEITIVDNGSTDPRMAGLYAGLLRDRPGSQVLHDDGPFNFSRLVNRAIAATTGETVLLLNNDVEIVHPEWLSEMVECLSFADTGIVGARLLYPNGTLQHAGVIVGLGGYAGHWYVERPAGTPGPQNRLQLRQSVSAVTAACMLVTWECLRKVGAFDEAQFAIAYNDVDFCLRAGRAGFRVVWTPNATLVHHESATRGSDEAPDKRARFAAEKAALERCHGTSTFEDPAFNPWFTRDRAVPGLSLPSTLPRPR